jgi:hypothetical protein
MDGYALPGADGILDGGFSAVSRRTLMKQAGLGAVAVGLVAGAPFGRAALHSAPVVAPDVSKLDGPIVAHVRDLSAGLVDVFVGERVVTVTDRGLAHSLAHIATA